MSQTSKLITIKIIYTTIWVFFNIVIFYSLYAVLMNKIDMRMWICLGLILCEAITLLIFKNVCPVTLVARRYTNSNKANFDIYLPNWLAKYNKLIYSVIVAIIIVILVHRLV